MVYLSSGPAESVGSAMLMCIVLLILSSPIIYAGWKNRGRFQELSSIESRPSDSSVGDYVLFSGRIRSISESIRSPLRGNSCCLAMWDICELKRRGTLGAGYVWSQEALGMKGGELVVDTEEGDVKVDGLSDKKVLNAGEKVKRSLMADSTTKFSSVEMELDQESFEERARPTEEDHGEYEDFSDGLGLDRTTIESYTIIGRLLSKLRTPEYTTRYREATFQTGDEISIIAKKGEDGVKFVESDSVSPLVSSRSISKILRRYRLAYLFQLYIIPIFCIGFSAILGYGAYL